MRNLTSAALNKIKQLKGTEPVIIVDIQWTPGGPYSRYADKDYQNIQGRILDVSSIDDVIKVSRSETTAELTVTLSDEDLVLRHIVNHNDIHFRNARVWQWFTDLPLSDAFLLFNGKINSPIDYSDADRTLTITILSELEATEIGFQPEEGMNFNWISDEYFDKPWPLAFGTVNNLPGQLVYKIPQGQTTKPLSMPNTCANSVVNGILQAHLEILNIQAQLSAKFAEGTLRSLKFAEEKHTNEEKLQFYNSLSRAKSDAAAQANRRIQEVLNQIAQALAEVQTPKEEDYGTNVGHVINGRRFPQNRFVTIKINGALFTGRFSGDNFYVTSFTNPNGECQDTQTGGFFYQDSKITYVQYDEKNQIDGFVVQPVYHMTNITEPTATNTYWFADGGSTVELVSNARELYVVNIIPSTVTGVYAYKGANGIETLQRVPESYYTVRSFPLNNKFTAVVVEMKRALSSYEEGWTNDQIYVNLVSSVGPNTANILRWLIETYSNYQVDNASFNTVANYLVNYPSNFALFTRKELLKALEEIAWQARCRIWINDNKFFISYLPAEPNAVATITESVIDHESLRLSHTPSEDIVTKLRAEWRPSYDYDEPAVVTVRYNTQKYGVHEQTFDFYIYNIASLVVKSAQFWAIRLGNTWKKVNFSCSLDLLNVETFDCVLFNLPGYYANGAVKALVEESTYDSGSNTINMQLWLPVRAGTMTKYDFAWPKNAPANLTWPRPDEVYAAPVSPGTNANGNVFNLPQNIDNSLPAGNGSASFARPSRPSDNADNAPPSPATKNDSTPTVKVEAPPRAISRQTKIQINPEEIEFNPPDPKLSTIDIRSTRIIDSTTNRTARLSSVFQIVDNPDHSGNPDDINANLVALWRYAKMADIRGSDVAPISFEYDGKHKFYRPTASFFLDDPDDEKSSQEDENLINEILNSQSGS